MFSIIGGNGSAPSQKNVNTSWINSFLFPTGESIPVAWLIVDVLRSSGYDNSPSLFSLLFTLPSLFNSSLIHLQYLSVFARSVAKNSLRQTFKTKLNRKIPEKNGRKRGVQEECWAKKRSVIQLKEETEHNDNSKKHILCLSPSFLHLHILTALSHLLLIFHCFLSFSLGTSNSVSSSCLPQFSYLSPSLWGESRAEQGRGLGLGLGRAQRRCSKAILICAHSHQRHSAWLVSLQEHQSMLSGTAVTNSNRYHFKTIGPAHCVWLKPVAGAHLGHGWMGLLRVQHTGAPAPGLTVGSRSDM